MRYADFVAGLWIVTAFCSAAPVAAQARLDLVVGATYFPTYVYDDADTREWGMDVAVRMASEPGGGLEIGYTYVPQATTGSSSPRLHAFRALVVGARAVGDQSQFLLRGGLGLAALLMRPQPIDCGPFPLCNEWAPRRGTRMAPMAEAGAAIRTSRRVTPFLTLRVHRPMGDEWSPNGDPDLVTQLSAGIGIQVGGGGAR